MRKILFTICLLMAGLTAAQSQVPLGPRFVLPFQTVIDATGVPIPGAFLFFYASGTSTKLNTYADSQLTTPNANPLPANAAGMFPNIFLDGNYKVVLTDSQLNQIWSADPVSATGSGPGGEVISVTNSDGTLTISPNIGSVVASLNLSNPNIWTAAQSFNPNDLVLKGSGSGSTTLNASAAAGTTTATLPANTGTIAETNLAQPWSAIQTFGSGDLVLSGSSSGSSTLNAPAAGGGTLTLPAGTDTLAGIAATQTLTGKTFDTAGAGNVFKINGNQVSAVMGTGNTAVLATGPTISNPTFTGSVSAAGLITNTDLANSSTTVNGQTCTLGGTCTITASAGSITAGTTTVNGGPGVLSNATSGGVLVSSTTLPSSLSATNLALTTPTLGVAAGTSLALGGATIGANALAVTGTTTHAGNVTISSGNLIVGAVTENFPASGNILGTTDTQTLTNKTISGSSNTLSNIVNASLTNSSITLGTTNIALGGTATTIAGGLTLSGTDNFTGTFQVGGNTQTFPGVASSLDALNVAQTFTAAKTFTNSDLLLLGSSTGATTFHSNNAGATAFTLNVPAINSTLVTQGDTNTIPYAAIAQASAYSFVGNFTASTANQTSTPVGSFPAQASPTGADLLVVADHTSGKIQQSTIAEVVGSLASGVTAIDSKTGAFTTSNGLDSTVGNVIELTAARRTLPTIQKFTSGTALTYTTPTNALWIHARGCGGGGGGSGGGTGAGNGTAGNNTTFGASLTGGGGGAGLTNAGGAGGTSTGSDIPAPGNAGLLESTLGTGAIGGQGGASPFSGGAGVGGNLGPGAGGAAGTNSGAGGGGGGSTANASSGGSGGGSGGCFDTIITSPLSTYTYTVGATAAGGTAGTSGAAGGTGAAGSITVDEHYGSWLLRRDLDPIANDNTPAFMNEAA